MQPLDTQDLVVNVLVVVMMPLIIWSNVWGTGAKTALYAHLWREHRNLMRLSVVFLGLIPVHAAVELSGHFGLISAATVEQAAVVLGLPMFGLSILILPLAVRAGWKAWRGRGELASEA